MNRLLRIRRKLSLKVSRSLIPSKFTIISDDCWGGQLYRQLQIPYYTPTVGLWIRPEHYLRYIEEFSKIHQEEFILTASDKDYPVASISGVELNFMHYKSIEEAKEKYLMRLQRIQRNRILIKIDFGKPGYTISDIHTWNKLRINNSLALHPTTIELPEEGVHNGVAIPDWQLDGSKMFDISRKYFDVFTWVRTGKIQNGFQYKALNRFFFNPTFSK